MSNLLDIVIPVHGRYDILEECLDAIPDAVNGLGYKIYLYDNGSDKQERLAFYKDNKDRWENLEYKTTSEGLGFPTACNRGARLGKSPLLFFLNSDVILDPDSVPKMVLRMDDPQVGVCGMKLIFPDDVVTKKLSEEHRPAGKIQHICISLNAMGRFHHIFVGWSENNKRANRVGTLKDVFAVTGAAFLTRRNLFGKIGGFDEIYGRGTFEDLDYCMKARMESRTTVVETKARGLHYVGATAEFYNLGYNLSGNQQIFLQRWHDKLMYWDWRLY